MIEFGMPTLIEASELDECAIICNHLKLKFIELNMNLPQYQLNKIDISHFKKIADKHEIFYTIHLDENLNISDFNPYIADGYRRTVRETIELAKIINAPVINMHLSRGVYFTLPNEKVYLFSEYKKQYLDSIINFRMMCENTIGDFPIMICIENCDGFHEFQIEALNILLDSPVFGLTFDIGHNYSCGNTDEPYIIKNKNQLRHMHMHDAIGQKNHLALGTGELNLDKYLSLASEQNCRVVIETKTIEGLENSIRWLYSKIY